MFQRHKELKCNNISTREERAKKQTATSQQTNAAQVCIHLDICIYVSMCVCVFVCSKKSSHFRTPSLQVLLQLLQEDVVRSFVQWSLTGLQAENVFIIDILLAQLPSQTRRPDGQHL